LKNPPAPVTTKIAKVTKAEYLNRMIYASDLMAEGKPMWKVKRMLCDTYMVSERQAQQYMHDARLLWAQTSNGLNLDEKRAELRTKLQAIYEKCMAQADIDPRTLAMAINAVKTEAWLEGVAAPQQVEVRSTNISIDVDGKTTSPKAVFDRLREIEAKYGDVLDAQYVEVKKA
jgi:hypothetical protein